jgi:hypothetical protein
VALLAAGLGIAAAGFEAGRRRGSTREAALLLRLTRTGVVLVGAGSLLLLVGGFWLADVRPRFAVEVKALLPAKAA